MKKILTLLLISSLLCQMRLPLVFAENEEHQTYDVTMTVENNIINTTTEKIFGYNQEWSDTDVRRNLWLDKNYAKYDSFENDFEHEKYYLPAPEYKEAYLTPGATKSAKYIANGDVYGGNVSYTRYMVKSGVDLYPNQYSGTVLQKPDTNVESVSDNVYDFLYKDNLVSGGIDGYMGFNTYWELAKGGINNYDIEDLTIISEPENDNNHLVKLAPSRGYQYFGRDSFFGKNHLAIIDRKTTFTYRIKIESDEADSRLGIVKDWNLEHIKDVEKTKYGFVSTLQFAKEYNTNQQRGWFDAIRFNNGRVYLAGEDVGEYEKSKWYTVNYTLDIKNEEYALNDLVVTDDTGEAVINESSDIQLDENINMGRDIYHISSITEDVFEFAERSDYGYLLTAHTKYDTASENTVVYIDDINFKTDLYYDIKDNVINEELLDFSQNYAFPYTRMAGSTANWFKWKEGLGRAEERNRIMRQSSSASVAPSREVWAIGEWLKMVDFMNPNAELSYVINVHDSDEDIVDLIEFMTAEGDINGDGVDWAQIRRENGIYAPARIYMWEIANEPNLNYMDPGVWQNKWDVESFLKRAGEIIEILKQYSPEDIKIAVPINTDYLTNLYSAPLKPENNWDRRYLNVDLEDGEEKWGYTNDIDLLAYHYYHPDRGAPVNTALMHLKENISKSSNPDIKIAYTEHGTNRPSKRSKYVEGIGLASALSEAQFFNRIFTEPIVDNANLHAFSLYPGGWGIGYQDNDSSFRAGATYMLMDMYAKNGVGDVLLSDIDGFETVPGQTGWEGWDHINQKWKDGKYGYSCSAVNQADGSLNLFISNHRNHTLNLTLDIDEEFDEYVIVEKSVITGKNEEDTITSYDGYSNICIGSEIVYDSNGNPTYVYETDADGNMVYDDEGNPIYVYETDAQGNIQYDENGNPIKLIQTKEVYELLHSNDMVYYTENDVSFDDLVIDPYSVTMLKLENKAVKPVSAKFKNQQRLDIEGKIDNVHDSRYVTLLIDNPLTGEIKYIAETTLDENDFYRFNFEFNSDLEGLRAIINYNGTSKDITDDFALKIKEEELFDISSSADNDTVTTIVNNRYNFLNLPCMMIVSGVEKYNDDMYNSIASSKSIILKDGINILETGDITFDKYRKILLWKNLYGMEPLFKVKYLK